MHACGHDGHIAGLLGAASILKEMESELSVRVKLIFSHLKRIQKVQNILFHRES